MTYMLKTGYSDTYGLARFSSHSHWRAGECQSCTLQCCNELLLGYHRLLLGYYGLFRVFMIYAIMGFCRTGAGCGLVS